MRAVDATWARQGKNATGKKGEGQVEAEEVLRAKMGEFEAFAG